MFKLGGPAFCFTCAIWGFFMVGVAAFNGNFLSALMIAGVSGLFFGKGVELYRERKNNEGS